MHMMLSELSITETLFGGIILAVLLFYISRKFGLSNFWAGIFSGIVPFLSYLIYCSQHWAGGDVLTIHFVIYLATAGILIVFGGLQKKKEPMHPVPKMIVGFFVLLVALNAIFISVAMHGLPNGLIGMMLPNSSGKHMYTGFAGALPHDNNQLYTAQIEQAKNQAQLGWTIQIKGTQDLKLNQLTPVTIEVLDKAHHPVEGLQVSMSFSQMINHELPETVYFKAQSKGNYFAKLKLNQPGIWLTDLTLVKGQISYQSKATVTVTGE
jgi:nitrogen fixation protein FixH